MPPQPKQPSHIGARSFPNGEVLFHKAHASWLEPRGYLRPEGPLAEDSQRKLFFRSSRRENAMRIDGPNGRTLFDKRFNGTKRLAALKRLWATGTYGPPTLSEWKALLWAQAAGLHVAEALACGEILSPNGGRDGWILTFQLPGLPLDSDHFESALSLRLESESVSRTRLKQSLSAAIGAAVAKLHAAQIAFPSCFAKHIYCDVEAPAWNLGFIDLADARIGTDLTLGERARDLAALCSTLPLHRYSWLFRKTLLRSYLRCAKLETEWPIRNAWRAIQRRVERKLERRRFRENFAPHSRGDLMAPNSGSLIIADEQEQLESLSENAASDGSDGWSSHEQLLLFRGPHKEAYNFFEIARTLRSMAVNAPRPVAIIRNGDQALKPTHSMSVFRNPWPRPSYSAIDPEDPRIEIIKRTLRGIGLKPSQGLASILRVLPDQTLFLCELQGLRRPRKLPRLPKSDSRLR